MNLYRHFDKSGTLLYVGISLHAVKRLGEHSHNSAWFESIDSVKIEKFTTRIEAQEAERVAIKHERPIHNIVRAEPKGEKAIRLEKIRKLSANSIDDLTARIVRFELLYSERDLKLLVGGVKTKTLEEWIAKGYLGYVHIPNGSKAGFKRMFTGWQAITLMEILVANGIKEGSHEPISKR